MITLYFMEQERTVTSWELSQMTHVSSRTIKGDIAQINQELKKQGEKLSPKKARDTFFGWRMRRRCADIKKSWS